MKIKVKVAKKSWQIIKKFRKIMAEAHY